MAQSSNCEHLDVDVHVQRSGRNRWTYYSCWRCGREWTETATVEDLSDTVTADEIIEVHQALANDTLTFDDLKE